MDLHVLHFARQGINDNRSGMYDKDLIARRALILIEFTII
jgi:hypothetical protein